MQAEENANSPLDYPGYCVGHKILPATLAQLLSPVSFGISNISPSKAGVLADSDKISFFDPCLKAIGSMRLFVFLVAFQMLWLQIISLKIQIKHASSMSIQDELVIRLGKQRALASFLFGINSIHELLHILDVENKLTASSPVPTPKATVILKKAYIYGFSKEKTDTHILKIRRFLEKNQTDQARFQDWRQLLLSDECLASWEGFWDLGPEELRELMKWIYPPSSHETVLDSPLNYLNKRILPIFHHVQLLERALTQLQCTGLTHLKAGWFLDGPSHQMTIKIVCYWPLIDTDSLARDSAFAFAFTINSPRIRNFDDYDRVALFLKWILVQFGEAECPKCSFSSIHTALQKLRPKSIAAEPHGNSFVARFFHFWGDSLGKRLLALHETSLIACKDSNTPSNSLRQAFFAGAATAADPGTEIEGLKLFFDAFQAKKICDLSLLDALDFAALIAGEVPSVFLQRQPVMDLIAPLKLSPTVSRLLLKRGCCPYVACRNNLTAGKLPFDAQILGLGAETQARAAYLELVPARTRYEIFVARTSTSSNSKTHMSSREINLIAAWTDLILHEDHARVLPPHCSILAFHPIFFTTTLGWQCHLQDSFNRFWTKWLRPGAELFVENPQSGSVMPHVWVSPLMGLVLGRFFVYALLSGVPLEVAADTVDSGTKTTTPFHSRYFDWDYFCACWDSNTNEHELDLSPYKLLGFNDDSASITSTTSCIPPALKDIIYAVADSPENEKLRVLTVVSHNRSMSSLPRDPKQLVIDTFQESESFSMEPRETVSRERFIGAADLLTMTNLMYFAAALAPVRTHFTALEAYQALFPSFQHSE